jgi:protein TonB
VKPVEPPKAPIPNQEPPPPPPKPEPPPPVRFGATEQSVTKGPSDFAIPVGNTTIADPKNVAKPGEQVQPLPAAAPGVAPAPVFRAASPIEIKEYPSIDDDDPFRNTDYTEEARRLEIEGETVVRVEVDERGKVHGVKVVKGLGHGLDEIVVRTFKSGRVRIRPAISTAGKTVSSYFTYTVRWVLAR